MVLLYHFWQYRAYFSVRYCLKIHEDGAVELVMKYGDIYALTIQSIKEVQEAM